MARSQGGGSQPERPIRRPTWMTGPSGQCYDRASDRPLRPLAHPCGSSPATMKFARRLLITVVLGLPASGIGPCASRAWAADAVAGNAENGGAAESFERDVAPLLARRCLGCHNAQLQKGGLDLTNRAAALTGGDSGAVLVAGNLAESELWGRVERDEMPPKKPLSAAEKSILRAWIAGGAAWSATPIDPLRFSSDVRAGYDWWSLVPLRHAPLPPVKDAAWIRNPIDAFVLERLEERHLAPSPPADRRTLMRRLSIDLLGLPPAPEDVAAFVADADPQAYEKLVDRLLASPRYGEHWARHWLDVARFGESDGFEYDVLRPRAWLYRDWVIGALNQDLPYDVFARQQIAGDILHPNDAAAVTATGFLVAGAGQPGPGGRADASGDARRRNGGHGRHGRADLPGADGALRPVPRSQVRSDPAKRVLPAFVGPVGREAWRARFAGRRSSRSGTDPVATGRGPGRVVGHRRTGPGGAGGRACGPRTRQAPQPIARWNFDKGVQDELGRLEVALHGTARVDGSGLHLDGKTAYAASPPLEQPLRAKTLEAWVTLANLEQRGGAAISVQTLDGVQFDAIVFGETEPGRWIVGSDNYMRTQRVDGPAEAAPPDELVHVAVVYAADGTITAYRNGRPYGQSYRSAGPILLPAAGTQVVFGLRHSPTGAGKLLDGVVRRAQLYDRALTPAEVADSADAYFRGPTPSQIVARLSPEQQARRTELVAQIAALDDRVHPRRPRVFAVKPQLPLVMHRLERGNPLAPKEVVTPGGVQAISGPAGAGADFGLPPDAPDELRRRHLAAWIASADNPLFARVIVNRLWHYHFGTGIVETPNDFGFNGGRPSHVELLDWLAGELVRQGFSLKRLHRTIVTSATYRQASRPVPAAMAVDAGGRLLWR